jgi:16S rRNA (adenine1518-N6/adenine1519-N6)-dimethyltransferase
MPRRLGQHFLKDKNALRRIADALDITHDDIVIEIGPGHGELTDAILARHPKKVILIEKDPTLAASLRVSHTHENGVKDAEIVMREGDVRDILATVIADDVPATQPYKIAGNIPYYLTGFLLRILGELPRIPSVIVLTMQQEVAERIIAGPPSMNKLAASVQFWADPEILFTIPAGAFHPAPEVESATVRLVPKKIPMDPAAYFPFIRQLFQQPRKNIANNLVLKTMSPEEQARRKALLASLGVAPHARAHAMAVSDVIALAKAFSA